MTRRLKVLQMVLDLEAGGLERLVADLVRGIDRSRFDVELLALSHLGREAEGLEAVAPVHTCRSLPLISLVWPRRVATAIRHIAPDIVHSHSGVWYKASRAARLAGVPRVIHTDHGRRHVPDYRRDRFFDRKSARRTDIVVAVSDPLARHMANGLVDPAKVRVIRNGVDTKTFAPHPDDGVLRAAWGIAPGRPVITTIGRFDPIKRYDLMIEAFAHLVKTGDWPAAPALVIAGEGPDEGLLRHRMAEVGLSADDVKLPGWVRNVHPLLALTTVFSLSSESEGTSVSLLEAMSAGICPVVTNVGGNGQVLGEALQHRLVPFGDARAMADAWRVALADPAARERDAGAARRRVEDVYSLDAMVRAYERLYLERN
ncbi:MAG TPA: glycosyltransferase [Gemmatimonadales bacterium]|nr:glycosyltransferase [Gemmatimonadales bacterium]